jgi:hypothetical protein
MCCSRRCSTASNNVGSAKQEVDNELMPVLATCGIRRQNFACESSPCCLLLLADSWEEEYNLKHSLAHLCYQGVTSTVQRILTFVTRLIGLCLQLLHHRFVACTTPTTTSLLLLMLTDLARSKSDLVAENVLLRQQLIRPVEKCSHKTHQ